MPLPIVDRRKARRVALQIPVRVRLWESLVPEQNVECLNISERGVYFASGSRFTEGERLQLVLKMPEEVIGPGKSNWLCVGQVVRTQALDSTSLALGVAVEFEPYQRPRSQTTS
jgi:PilZ domain